MSAALIRSVTHPGGTSCLCQTKSVHLKKRNLSSLSVPGAVWVGARKQTRPEQLNDCAGLGFLSLPIFNQRSLGCNYCSNEGEVHLPEDK